MTIHSLVDRFRQLFSWLWYRHQWTVWELLAVTGSILLLSLWVAKKRRDQRKARALTHLIRQSSSVIGTRLASRNHSPAAATDLKRPRLPFLTGRQNGQMSATEPATASNQTTGLLQHKILKRQQTEAYLQQQLDELKTANEKLQSQNSQCKEAEDRLRRRMARLLATGKKLRQKLERLERAEETLWREPDAVASQQFGGSLGEVVRAKKHPKWSPLELLAAHRLSRGGPNSRGHDGEMLPINSKRCIDSRRTKEPLDVEKLKAIAALAKQIQSQSRRS